MSAETPCFICGQPAGRFVVKGRFAHGVNCRTCGRYEVSEMAKDLLGSRPDLRPGLSAHVRSANLRGETPAFEISNWEGLANRHVGTPVPVKLARVLRHLEEKSSHPGAKVQLDGSRDYPLFDAANPGEVGYLIVALQERGDIVSSPGGNYVITPAGWDRLAPAKGSSDPSACFVAMSSDPSLDDAYDLGIRPAIEKDCGYSSVRIDRVEHNHNINDKIINELLRCHFLVADFTGHRNGVYFEAGYVLGLV